MNGNSQGPVISGGLGCSEDEKQKKGGNVSWWKFTHNAEYQKMQGIFLKAIKGHDHEGLFSNLIFFRKRSELNWNQKSTNGDSPKKPLSCRRYTGALGYMSSSGWYKRFQGITGETALSSWTEFASEMLDWKWQKQIWLQSPRKPTSFWIAIQASFLKSTRRIF